MSEKFEAVLGGIAVVAVSILLLLVIAFASGIVVLVWQQVFK